jgi:hypothetical protein
MIVRHVMCAGCVEDPCIGCCSCTIRCIKWCAEIPDIGAWIMRMRGSDGCAGIHKELRTRYKGSSFPLLLQQTFLSRTKRKPIRLE